MGFFIPELDMRSEQPKVSRKKLAATALTGEKGCDACTLKQRWPQLATPKMPVTHIMDAPDILVLGEAPGKQEDEKGRQFVGKTGSFLRDEIPGRFDSRIAYQNAVRCRPPENRTPNAQEVYACSKYLDDEIDRLPIKTILGVGGVPLSRFVPKAQIMRHHGIRFPVKVAGHKLWYFPVMHPSFVLRMQGKYDEGPAYPVWQSDLRKFFREVDDWGKPEFFPLDKAKVILPRTREDADALVHKMRGPVAVDIETTDLRPYNKNALLLSASMSDGDTTIAFPINHPQAKTTWGLDFLLHIVETRHWVAHNTIFELAWFLFYSAQENRARDIHYFEDTMALARLYFQRNSLLDLGLVSHALLGTNVKELVPVNTRRLLEYPITEVLQYNGLDSMATAPCYHKMRPHVPRANYEQLIARVESFATMQLLGLDVNPDAVKELQQEWTKRIGAAAERTYRLYEVKQYEKTYGEFNIGSPAQVGRALAEFGNIALPKTDKGQYITDDETLKNIAADHPLVEGVLEWREGNKLKGTYIDPMLAVAENTVDGRIHPCYSPLLVATFRSSSEDPNAQNYPKRKHRELRKPVEAPEGHVVAAFDYGQLQVRILAMASRDKRLIRNLLDGVDTHSQWLDNCLRIYPAYLDRLAEETGQKDEAKIRKAGRDIIKSDFVFNSFFGGGIANIARRTRIPEDFVAELQGEFWEEFRGVRKWQGTKRREYKDTGAVTDGLNGWIRRGMMTGNEPINTPIQMGEANIVFEAQTELSRLALKRGDLYLHPRINIHDDLTFILPEDERLGAYIDLIAHAMIKVRFDWQIVPLNVEVKVGPNWCDLKEVNVFTGEYNER